MNEPQEKVSAWYSIAWGYFVIIWLCGFFFFLTLSPHTVRCIQADNRLFLVVLRGIYPSIAQADYRLILIVYTLTWLVLLAVVIELCRLIWEAIKS